MFVMGREGAGDRSCALEQATVQPTHVHYREAPTAIMMRTFHLLLMFMHLLGVAAQAPFARCYDDLAPGALSPWTPMLTPVASNELLIAWPRSAALSDSLNVLHLSSDGEPLNAYQLRRNGSNFRIRETQGATDGSILHTGHADGGHLLLRTNPSGATLSGFLYTVDNGVSSTLPAAVRHNDDGTVCSSWHHLDGTNGQGSIIMNTDLGGDINWVFKLRVDDEPTDLRTIIPLTSDRLLLLGAISSTVDGTNTVHSAMVVINDQGDVLWAQRLQADNAEHITLMGGMQRPDGTLLVGGSHGIAFGEPTHPVVMAFDANGAFLWGAEHQPALPSQYHLGPTQVEADGDSALIFLGLTLDAMNVFLLRVNAEGQVIDAHEQPVGTSEAVVHPDNGIYYTQRDTSSSGVSIPCLYHPDPNGASCQLPAVAMTSIPFAPNIHTGWLPIDVDVQAEDITDQFQVLPRPLPIAIDQCKGLPTTMPDRAGTTVTLTPNPASNVVRMVGASVHRAIVMDASGRVVLDRTFAGGQVIELNVDDLRPGMYLARLHGVDGHHVVRFVKE